jgi:hypothetical protein
VVRWRQDDDLTTVSNLLERRDGGTRFTWGLPVVLGDLDDHGKLRPGSPLKPAL